MKWTYLWVNFLTIIIPFIFSFHPKINFHKHFKAFIAANIVASIIFISWDIVFTSIGVWGFNPNYVSGLSVVNLPIEEVLFFICIPFACVFTYHSLNLYFNFKWNARIEHIFVIIFSGLLILTAVLSFHRLYTFTTFLSLGILLLVLKFWAKITWLPSLLTTYLFLLFPFFIVNGILTGTGLDQPVVWYDNSENLCIRLLTIPVEDIFYGLELVVVNVFFYELFKANKK